MGSLFSSSEKKEKKKQQQQQQQQKSSYPSKFPSQKKEISEGEKQRMKLQHQRDQLREKRKQIELEVTNYDQQIKQLISVNKREQAKYVLQRKMLYDKFLENILQKEHIISQSIVTVDQIQSDKEMADLITQTNQVVKDIQDSIDQGKLQDAMMDMQEAKQKNQEMNDMYKQYQVDDEREIDELYGKYEKELFATKPQQQQQFVPLPQKQQESVYQPQQQQQQEHNEYTDKLAMLE